MSARDVPQMAEPYGLPTYYTTDCVREDAGDGNVRIWNCVRRNGVLIPQCEVIVPAGKLQTIGRDVSDFASEMYHRLMLLQTGQLRGIAH